LRGVFSFCKTTREINFVIPGRAEGADPESINPVCE